MEERVHGASSTIERCVWASSFNFENLVLRQIYRLIETTGLSRGEIKKWFSEQRLLNIKGENPAPDWMGDTSVSFCFTLEQTLTSLLLNQRQSYLVIS